MAQSSMRGTLQGLGGTIIAINAAAFFVAILMATNSRIAATEAAFYCAAAVNAIILGILILGLGGVCGDVHDIAQALRTTQHEANGPSHAPSLEVTGIHESTGQEVTVIVPTLDRKEAYELARAQGISKVTGAKSC